MLQLKKYGLDWTLNPVENPVPKDYTTKIALTRFSRKDNSYFVYNHKGIVINTLVRSELIAKGSYGRVFKCTSDDKVYAMKEIHFVEGSDSKLINVIKEVIIQIIISEETNTIDLPSHELIGPFVPNIYSIGYDPEEHTCYIQSEIMDDTFDNFLDTFPDLNSLSQKEKDTMIIISIIKIMKILGILQHKLKFNHRDFKMNNCMYKTTKYGLMDPVLIDFGLSCLNYKGLTINASQTRFKYCYVGTRDVTQILYSCARYNKEAMSSDLYNVFKALLTLKRRGKVCSLLDKQCEVTNWKNTYRLVNTTDGENPNAEVTVVIQVLTAFLKEKPWNQHLLEQLNNNRNNKTKRNEKTT